MFPIKALRALLADRHTAVWAFPYGGVLRWLMTDVCVLPAPSLDNQQGSDSHFCRFNLQFSKTNHLSPISASYYKEANCEVKCNTVSKNTS